MSKVRSAAGQLLVLSGLQWWVHVLVIQRSLLVLQLGAGSGILMRGIALEMVLEMPSLLFPLDYSWEFED